MSPLYQPREDSFLLQQYVRKYAKGMVLDMGTGTGIQALTVAQNRAVKKVLGVDRNKASVRYCQQQCKHPKITYAYSDLFSHVKGTFDTIIFNPPYLPAEPRAKDMALDGGKKGYELLERFLSKAGNHLNDKGNILIVFSSLTNKSKIDQILLERLLLHELLATQHIFFENLYAYRIWKHPAQALLRKKSVNNIAFLTKGKRGMIFTGRWKGKKVAIKLQLPHVAVKTITHEYRMLKLANKHRIGPKALWCSNNCMVYGFVEGSFFPAFAMRSKDNNAVQSLLGDIFRQCRTLDILRLTKEEMHHPVKHIIVTKRNKAVLLDFERCKKTKKPKNVTQFCQYLASPMMQRLMAQHNITVTPQQFRSAAQRYKHDPSDKNFRCIIALVAVQRAYGISANRKTAHFHG